MTRDSAESNKYTSLQPMKGSYVYTVAVTYDGEYMTWQVVE